MRPPFEFSSTKAARPIPVRHRLVHDALIIAALDPAVTAIELIPTVDVCGTAVPLDAIVITVNGARRLLDVPVAEPAKDIDEQAMLLLAAAELGLPALKMSAEDIAHEPRASNVRLVWGCRHGRISPTDRIRVLAMLAEESPVTLLRAAMEVRNSADPVGAVLALACLDLIEIDLVSQPFGPATSVMRRER